MKISKNIIIIGSVVIIIVIGVILYFVFGTGGSAKAVSVAVTTSNITEKINLTGQVKASEGVDLAFVSPGKIVASYVKVGDKIYAGQTLAALDSSSAGAALTSAKGSLAQAQANYGKLLAGATQQNINTSQDVVNLAKQNLTSAYNGAINALNNAYTSIYNASNIALTIQNNYFTSQDPQGIQISTAKNDINANLQTVETSLGVSEKSLLPADIDATITQTISSLNNAYDDINTIRAQCDQGIYYYKVTDADKATLDGQKTAVNATLSGLTTLQQNIAALKLGVQTAQDQLSVTTAPPTQENIDLAKAQVLSAQGQVDAAQAAVSNTVISAPFGGQVDKDNVNIGQIASPSVPVITISNNNLEIDTYIPEVDLASAKVGGKADITLDAFGNSVVFPATIFSIDLAPTNVNGISAYGAKMKFDSADSRINPGMTANIMIISDTHSNVLTVPKSAVIQNNNKYFVVVDDGNSKKETVEVVVGLHDDQNFEIVSGLKLGEKVFAY